MTLSLQANTDVIEDLARRTATAVELVKDLYEEEVTKLKADETVEGYIPVSASQRVKRELRMRSRSAAQPDSRNSARKPERHR